MGKPPLVLGLSLVKSSYCACLILKLLDSRNRKAKDRLPELKRLQRFVFILSFHKLSHIRTKILLLPINFKSSIDLLESIIRRYMKYLGSVTMEVFKRIWSIFMVATCLFHEGSNKNY